MRELCLLIICTLSFVTLFGAVIFMVELFSGDFTFSSIPAGMWWAVVTMTTVGYGDVYPVSTVGQMVGAVCALSGVILLALPVAVIASRFTSYQSNMSSRQQMRTTLTFLKGNPQFSKSSCLRGKMAQEGEMRVPAHDLTHGDEEGTTIITKGNWDIGKHRWAKRTTANTRVHLQLLSEVS